MERRNGSVTARHHTDTSYRSRDYPYQNGPSTSDTDEGSTYSSLNRRNPRLPAYAFILPNLEKYSEEFRRFVEKDIIEIATLRRLEASGHLNWWCRDNPTHRLLPLITQGDGNCLLHAASLGIWGVHDRQLNLRQLLYEALTASEKRFAFYRRWRWHETKSNLQSELILSETEWKKEWASALDLASPAPRVLNNENGAAGNSPGEQIYESLELIHVYALANVLKRPIIVVADEILRNANGESISPVPFGGVYLPLEISPQQCHRSPLVLCYDSSHFSPLVAIRQTTTNCLQAVPITDRNRNLLPIHFAIDPGARFNWWKDPEDQRIATELDDLQTDDWRLELVGKYMDIVKMDLRRGSVKKTTPVQNGSEFTPSVPIKLLTLASGDSAGTHHKSRILSEIRQHFRWLGRRSKKKYARPIFSAEELRQSNCVLTVLLHNFPHEYIDSMLNNYLNDAKQRFEGRNDAPASALTPKNRHRISRSFSLSTANLTCLNGHCNKTASPSTNFLCAACFEDQKRDMISIGGSSSSASSASSSAAAATNCSSNAQNGNTTSAVLSPTSTSRMTYSSSSQSPAAGKSKSSTMPSISTAVSSANNAQASSSASYFADSKPHHLGREAPIRYADESTSASSTVSSRNGGGAYSIHSPTPLSNTAAALPRYFYEQEEEDEDAVVTRRPYAASFDYALQPPHLPSYYSAHGSSALPSSYGGRVHSPPSPMYYNGAAPHSLPRVSVNTNSAYRSAAYGGQSAAATTANGHYYPSRHREQPQMNGNSANANGGGGPSPNVTYVKTCSASSNNLKNKVPPSNGVSFYYAAS